MTPCFSRSAAVLGRDGVRGDVEAGRVGDGGDAGDRSR